MVDFSDEVVESLEAFYTEFGRTMASWGDVEAALADWFRYLADLDPVTASAIFYSARSFGGRVDMLTAVVGLSKLEDSILAVVRAAIKKALAYNGFRNALAHHRVVFRIPGGMHSAPGNALNDGHAYNRRDLVKARDNFIALYNALQHVTRHPSDNGMPHRQCLELIQRLPSQANSSEPTQIRKPRKLRQKLPPAVTTI